jgi:hypothetical protein
LKSSGSRARHFLTLQHSNHTSTQHNPQRTRTSLLVALSVLVVFCRLRSSSRVAVFPLVGSVVFVAPLVSAVVVCRALRLPSLSLGAFVVFYYCALLSFRSSSQLSLSVSAIVVARCSRCLTLRLMSLSLVELYCLYCSIDITLWFSICNIIY